MLPSILCKQNSISENWVYFEAIEYIPLYSESKLNTRTLSVKRRVALKTASFDVLTQMGPLDII